MWLMYWATQVTIISSLEKVLLDNTGLEYHSFSYTANLSERFIGPEGYGS